MGGEPGPEAAEGRTPRILVWGGHGFTLAEPDRAIRDYMLSLASGVRPRICLLPTASGDPADQIARFHNVFGDRGCEPSDVSLFRLGNRPMALREHLLAQDLIYVGGGSMVNLLAIWGAHDIASILTLAWRQGIVIAGQSAGAMCWFEAGVTKSSGHPRPVAGLGILPGSLCVHYHSEPERRPVYREAIAAGMPAGHALDDYAGLLYEDRALAGAVSARPGAGVWRVEKGADGTAVETRLEAEDLHPDQPPETPEDIAEFRRATRGRQRAGWLG